MWSLRSTLSTNARSIESVMFDVVTICRAQHESDRCR